MSEFILTTVNSKYIHASLGLRYLYANMNELQTRCKLIEFTLKDNANIITEKLIKENPTIIGFGVYIWNVDKVHEVVSQLNLIKPNLKIVLGGPEVSFEQTLFKPFRNVDIIKGEADSAFYNYCKNHSEGITNLKNNNAEKPDLLKLKSPYPYITDEDIKNKLIYVESSRGCVFKCEFCLSSIEENVRTFNLDLFLSDMKVLLDRGCRQFKFVDRTFNLNIKDSKRILLFFLNNIKADLFLHFEMIPDHFPESLKELVTQFGKDQLQFEIGIQSFTPEVLSNISRKMKTKKTIENLTFLKEKTNVHTHTDLIVGLPGEDLESFASSFNQLINLRPGEIQVGILKNLIGTPIKRHIVPHGLIFEQVPPYSILQSNTISYLTMQKLKRFARYVELYYNSGRFNKGLDLLFETHSHNPFKAFLEFGEWIWNRSQQEHAIGLKLKFEYLINYLLEVCNLKSEKIVEVLAEDFMDPNLNPKGLQNALPDALRENVDEIRRKLKL